MGYLPHKLKHVKLAALLSDKKNQESEGLNNSSVVSYSATIGLENESGHTFRLDSEFTASVIRLG